VLQRAALRDILAGALASSTVVDGVAVRELSATAAGVRLHLTDTSARDVDAVVGADGTGSVVARHLNGSLTRRYAGYTAWRGVASIAIDPDLAGETMGAGAQLGHVPMGPDRTYWFATERAPEGASAPHGELDYLRAKFASWAAPIPDLLAATDPDGVLRNDLYDRSPARRWSAGPVVLVGDAAHPMRPHLGQGGCQALEDAAVLGAFLDLSPDLPLAFAAFESFRRRRVRAIAGEARLIGRVVNLRPAVLSALATRATVVLPEFVVTRHLASIAARTAFRLPTRNEV